MGNVRDAVPMCVAIGGWSIARTVASPSAAHSDRYVQGRGRTDGQETEVVTVPPTVTTSEDKLAS